MSAVFRCLRFLPVLILVCLLGRTSVGADWHMATPYPEANFHTANIRQFAAEVEEATNGEVRISVHSAGSLFKHAQIKTAVRSGQVQLGEFLLSRLANENPLFEADSVPFLAANYEEARELWKATRPHIDRLLARQGLVVLFSVPWPPQGLFSVAPIVRIENLAGMKFRAYNAATERIARLLSALPTQVEVPDIPQAFATGRIDVMMTSPSTGADTKAWDYVGHYYHLQAWLPKNVVVANRRALDRLPAASRQVTMDAALRAEIRGWSASIAETEQKLQALRVGGVTVQNASPALAREFSGIGKIMITEWKRQAGEPGEEIANLLGK